MIAYLKNILPRLKEFSENLDKIELFVDKQWVYIDGNANYQTYIFKRDNRLIMSLNGDAQTGKWEFLPEAQSLLIDRNNDKILLNQAIVFDGLMMLRKDGSENSPWVLVNKAIIPDLDYISYIRGILKDKMQLTEFNLRNGKTYYYNSNGTGLAVYCRIFDDCFRQVDGEKELETNDGKFVTVNDSIITGIVYTKYYDSEQGTLTIYQQRDYTLSKGDTAYLGEKAANGRFVIGAKKETTINAEDGKITSFKNKLPKGVIIFMSLQLLLLAYVLIRSYLETHH